MRNFILKDENAVFYECGYSCDNEIYISICGENFFITDARYSIESTKIQSGNTLKKQIHHSKSYYK